MATLTVAATATVDEPLAVTFGDGRRPALRFVLGGTTTTVRLTQASGTYIYTPDAEGTLTIKLMDSKSKVLATAMVEVSAPSTTTGYGSGSVPALSTYLKTGYLMVYDGHVFTPTTDSSGLRMDGGFWADASVQKVVKNCTFTGYRDKQPLVPKNCQNVLIYGCTFDDDRTNTAGVGLHAINADPSGTVDDITVAGCRFLRIGADGIQWGGGTTRTNYEWLVEYNDFIGPGDVVASAYYGENAMDIKGVEGPISILNNVIRGYRPCLSPKVGGTQDCSGSQGTGVVVHRGSGSGQAKNVTITGNLFENNSSSSGLTIGDDSTSIDVGTNTWRNNTAYDLLFQSGASGSVANTQDTDSVGIFDAGPATRY